MSLPESFYMGEKNGIKGFPAERNEMILPISAAAKAHLVSIGAVSAADTARMGNTLRWTIKMRGSKGRNYLQKQDLMIMDILRNIAAQDWKRPMYFAISVPSSSFVSLNDYMVLEGMALRVVPVRQQTQQGLEPINREIMYRILMEKYRFRNMTDPDVFFDSNSRRMASNFQSNYVRLATDYVSEAERNDLVIEQAQRFRLSADTVAKLKADNTTYKEKAKKLIDHITKVIADEVVDTEPYTMTQYASVYASTGEKDKAKQWLAKARTRAQATLLFQKARYGTPLEDRMTTASYQMLAYTYLKDLQDRESALAVANEYRQYTGSDYILNFLSQQPELQNLPETQPTDSNTPKTDGVRK